MKKRVWSGIAIAVAAVFFQPVAFGHCDTLDGPVIEDARAALKAKDVTGVLQWVQKDKEEEIRLAFKKTLVVREKGPEAQELADTFFFETLVRVHRAGEGAPYTGLKPSGTAPEPGVAEADAAIKSGRVDDLVKAAGDTVAAGIRKRFADVVEARKHAGESVEAGRRFVAAYVEFVHHVEKVFAGAKATGHDAKETESPAHGHDAPVKAAPHDPAHHH